MILLFNLPSRLVLVCININKNLPFSLFLFMILHTETKVQVKCRLLDYDIFVNQLPVYFGKCQNFILWHFPKYAGNSFKNMA